MDVDAALRSERATLGRADRDIRDGESRIRRQRNLVAGLRTQGHDTREAERFLTLLQEVLARWHDHRALIVQRIAHLEARSAEVGKPGLW